MLDFQISKLVNPDIYNLVEDCNFVKILNFSKNYVIPQIYKGVFFKKISYIYNNVLLRADIDLLLQRGLELKRSPGLCKEWIKNYK